MPTAPIQDLFANDEVPAADNSAAAPSYLHDHRKRLRSRFMHGGADALPDYEVLELVLFRAIPRADVKPLAHRLLSVFGSFNAVVAADPARLEQVKGVGCAVVVELKIVEAAAHRLAQSALREKPLISSWDAVVAYCRTTLAHRDTEHFRVLFLDRKNRLIADETQSQGTVDQVQVYPREVIKRALELSASALILVHNHPSGDPTPSPEDIDLTRAIATAASALDIVLHDHLIVGRFAEASLRAQGHL